MPTDAFLPSTRNVLRLKRSTPFHFWPCKMLAVHSHIYQFRCFQQKFPQGTATYMNCTSITISFEHIQHTWCTSHHRHFFHPWLQHFINPWYFSIYDEETLRIESLHPDFLKLIHTNTNVWKDSEHPFHLQLKQSNKHHYFSSSKHLTQLLVKTCSF